MAIEPVTVALKLMKKKYIYIHGADEAGNVAQAVPVGDDFKTSYHQTDNCQKVTSKGDV
jgi:hypothetical protein